MSERILGAIIGIHGDNKGLIIPPNVAPIQVVIIPIIFKDSEKETLKTCDELDKNLHEHNIKSHIDKRDISPGNKYYDWELKGIPLRIEIGPRDIKNKKVILVRRDTGEKKPVPITDAAINIKEELNRISDNLYDNAKKFLENNTHHIKTIEEAKEKKGIIELPWCGNEDCALEIENIIEGNTLGEPVDQNIEYEKNPCPICGEISDTWMRYARTY
jgi:prolyl-tRNA synthetase